MHLSRSIDGLFQRYLCSGDLLASLAKVIDSLVESCDTAPEPFLLGPTSPVSGGARKFLCREAPWQ
jgi:hypothetical protein